jgi:hypothetical protein
MKDAEDEAFDELAKRQGSWGGGFKAKQAMAADKINWKRGSIALAKQLCYEIAGATNEFDDFSGSEYGSVDIAEILSAEVERLREALAQPAQEPVAWEQFYPDIGKNQLAYLPPSPFDISGKPQQRPWVGLTPEDILALFDEHNLYGSKLVEFARAVETKIKEKNNG